jgi:hypothetical protein
VASNAKALLRQCMDIRGQLALELAGLDQSAGDDFVEKRDRLVLRREQ